MAALEGVSEDAVLAGIFMGGAMAARAWTIRPKARGVLFLAGPGDWPEGATAPVQMHAARPDPFDEEEVFRDWEAANPGVPLEVSRYEGAGHFFFDPSLADHDAAVEAACRARSLAFLAGL